MARDFSTPKPLSSDEQILPKGLHHLRLVETASAEFRPPNFWFDLEDDLGTAIHDFILNISSETALPSIEIKNLLPSSSMAELICIFGHPYKFQSDSESSVSGLDDKDDQALLECLQGQGFCSFCGGRSPYDQRALFLVVKDSNGQTQGIQRYGQGVGFLLDHIDYDALFAAAETLEELLLVRRLCRLVQGIIIVQKGQRSLSTAQGVVVYRFLMTALGGRIIHFTIPADSPGANRTFVGVSVSDIGRWYWRKLLNSN